MIRSALRQVRLDFESQDDLGVDRAGQMRNHLVGNVDQIDLLARQFGQFDLHPGDPKQTWRMLGIELHQ
jgi:hypothetical protein